MRPVFDYLDYRDLLKDAYEARKAESSLFSYRIMADILGLDAGNLFRVLQKDLHLPARCQPRALEFLGTSGRSAEYVLILMAYGRERGRKARQELLDKAIALRDVACRELAGEELAFFRDWWVVATRCIVEVDGRAQPSEIAARLRPAVPESEVKYALDLLQKLGLAKKAVNGGLVLTEAHLTATGKEKVQALWHFQKQILHLAGESLERFPKEERDVSTITFAVDAQASFEIREMLRECRRQIQKRIDESRHPDRVMQLAMAFFPLAPATGGPA
jgi:uncharacterized protein (TIGR02147 family)